ncbi:ferredoxin family protein, partial [Acidobacteriota bacterium]
EAVERVSLRGSAKPMVHKDPEKVNSFVKQESSIPEGQYLIVDKQKCVHCGLCFAICPADVFKHDERWNLVVNYEECVECGICDDVCPLGAIYVRKSE